MVSYNFIDLSDGEWHLIPVNAINAVFEGRSMTQNVHVEVSHDKVVAHSLYALSHNNNHDHYRVGSNNSDFMLQFVRVRVGTDPATSTAPASGQTFRVYFGFSRKAK